ncbi:tetratricopeptide repeat protein [Archangium violaceum]|uniref:tetratricopeptide repeat protein n=1 Tax=Archangium violaceum TaxID=83451 RepID=UPI001951FC95|nr:tetratricopeptide repeat protein [Archangium violaceum]QRN95659.1 tetratricopeptide repeat protein [Archangium violaceum]
MGKRSKRRQTGGGGLVTERLRAARVSVDALLEEGRTAEARAVLTRLGSRFPDDPRVLEALVDLTYEVGDTQGYQCAVERLLPLRPDDPDLALALAAAALVNLYPVTAIQAFRRFLARWPSHPNAAEARQTLEQLEKALPEVRSGLGLAEEGEKGERIALEHERIQHLLASGRAHEAREAAEALHVTWPRMPAILNNLGMAAWTEGDSARAEAAFWQVLESHPDNVHALANLTRVFLLSGRTEEAHAVAKRLEASTAPADERWLKIVEALTYLGDDVGVLETLEKMERGQRPQLPSSEAQLRHMAAVAALRLGDSDRASRLWVEALELAPDLEPALRNLEALDLPVALRPAPWAFELSSWLPPVRINALGTRLAEASENDKEKRRLGALLMEEFPELRPLVPLLLDRGSPEGVRLILGLCDLMEEVPFVEELKRFALGERGALGDRFRAARVALLAGAAREDEMLLWTGKRRQPYRWLDIEVSTTALRQKHTPKVERLLERSVELLQLRHGRKAEQLLREALALEPDSPDLMNNLAVARQVQGHTEEAERMIEEVHQRWPDYFFGRCAVARLRIQTGRLEEARQLLEPLLSQRILHVSEVSALCAAHMELLLAEKDEEGAWVWLHILETSHPGDPQVELYRDRLELMGGRLPESWMP